MFGTAIENLFAREVRAGLTRAGQKTLPCRYLYDAVGSALFEAITELPEYGLTRADTRLLETYAGEIAAHLPRDLLIAELGSGSGAKTRPILRALMQDRPVRYFPIDVSSSSLARCARELDGLCRVTPLEASYLEGLQAVASHRQPGQTLFVLFLGSTIGNFEPESAIGFLSSVRALLAPCDALLLGTDLVKPEAQLLDAYDDPAGVTAAFNLNLLARINRELGADFNLRGFEHVARYVAADRRVEMHLRARAEQTVHIPESELTVEFPAGETIHTESCHKFTPSQIAEMARLSGFRVASAWTDQDWPFAENLLAAI
jgi:L-histidine N-alpha-methyltransferase